MTRPPILSLAGLRGGKTKEIRRLVHERDESWSSWSPRRLQLASIVTHPCFEGLIGLLILVDILAVAIDVDARLAECDIDHEVPPWSYPRRGKWLLPRVLGVLLAVFSLESLAKFYVFRLDFFKSGLNWLDVIIVACGWVTMAVDLSLPQHKPNYFQFLLGLRLVCFARASRLVKAFPELDKMIRGFFPATKAMGWGMIMLIIFLIYWSAVSVYFLDPVNQRVHVQKKTKCSNDAFSSIFNSALTLSQTLVAGDSWGECAKPVIKEQPWTFGIFAGAFFSVSLGVINLILAIVVDSAARVREADMQLQVENKNQQEVERLEHVKFLIKMMDKDDDGMITRHELLDAYDSEGEIGGALRHIDIRRSDLQLLFTLLDHDNNGSVSSNELIESIYKAQRQDMRMYTVLIRMQIGHLTQHMAQIQEHLGISGVGPGQLPGGPGGASRSTACPSLAPSVQTVSQVFGITSVRRDEVDVEGGLSSVQTEPSARTDEVDVESGLSSVQTEVQLEVEV